MARYMVSAEPRLSILIPVLGDFAAMEQGLVSVLENRPDRCEIVLAFNRPYADPYDLQDEAVFVQAARGAGLVECLNVGLRHCRAAIVHVLACGAEATPEWTDAALAHFDNPRVGAVAPVVIDAADRQTVVSAGLTYRAGGRRLERGAGTDLLDAAELAGNVVGPVLAAAFYRRELLVPDEDDAFEIGVGDALADVDVAMQLRGAGFTSVCEPRSRVYLPGATPSRTLAFAAGRQAERLFLRSAPVVGWTRALLAHATCIASADGWLSGRLLRATAALAGRAAAWTEWPQMRRHHARLLVRRQLQAQGPAPLANRPHLRLDAAHGAAPAGTHTANVPAARRVRP
ncbi:MAG: glycosyltransferase [Pirellulales bacterium]|nr:glycosyltransferase [Pirellulales bacterium]